MKAIGCNTELRLSFDGIGLHDWIRNHKGAEQKAIDAIKLCIDNGFKVTINEQINRRNLHTIMPTVKMLNDMGVSHIRLVKTTEVPRWVQNVPDGNLNLEEFYGHMLEFAKEYTQSGMNTSINIWQYLSLFPKEKSFSIKSVRCPDGSYHDNICCCSYSNSIFSVNSSGEIMPCPYMAGYFLKYGINLGNLHKTPLKELLKSGSCVDIAKMTLGQLHSSNNKCSKCNYFKFCGGGCRAFGLLFCKEAGDFKHEDITNCYFFENGWYQKITQALSEWKNLSEIEDTLL